MNQNELNKLVKSMGSILYNEQYIIYSNGKICFYNNTESYVMKELECFKIGLSFPNVVLTDDLTLEHGFCTYENAILIREWLDCSR